MASAGAALPCLRIAAEEAFATRDIIRRYREGLERGSIKDPGFNSLMGFYLRNPSERSRQVADRLQDLGAGRIADMDATGIARQILGLTCPGVQIFDAPTGTALAIDANDELAAACARYPDRFSGLAAIAPQDPDAAAREIERAVRRLGLKGVIVNSHTQGEYLDDPKYWAIFEAAEACGVPLYLHPNTPSPAMIQPLLERGLDGAIYGFAVETGMHLLGIILRGVFERFPRLRLVVGHLGEALPYWLFRIDFMHGAMARTGRYPTVKPLPKKPSEYFRANVWLTTSGMAWQPVILFAQQLLGMDRVMYAMDYPYQFVPDEVAVTDRLPISDADKPLFYQTNAERVFGL